MLRSQTRRAHHWGKNRLCVLALPVTQHNLYLYCSHPHSQVAPHALPLLVRAEQRMLAVAARAWLRLERLSFSVNQKIVAGAKALLARIPYDESCLLSFPSQRAMVREAGGGWVVTARLTEAQRLLLKPVPVVHPLFVEPLVIMAQMHAFKTTREHHHRKNAIWCALGIPLTVPFTLVPVVPNVPFFYLAYRLYCHVKALQGVRNLGYLMEGTHLVFEPRPEMDEFFGPGDVVLREERIDDLAAAVGAPLQADLRRAVAQERRALLRHVEKSTL